MELQYFGTDGIRGRAFASPLTIEEVSYWGKSWGNVTRSRGIKELVIGWDPRLSSETLVRAFLSGLNGAVRTCILGLVPTPAVAYAVTIRPSSWGLVFSASHNPPDDNGIKSFNGYGEKNSEEEELALEAEFNSMRKNLVPSETTQIDLTAKKDVVDAYIKHLGGIDLPDDISVVVDCANGATAPWAPLLLRGSRVHWLGVPADGAKINLGTGSSNIDYLSNEVRKLRADTGIAFDGDGDRCLIVDSDGNVVDGDQLLWLITQDFCKNHRPPQGVVGTIMSNSGLEEALRGLGISFVRTAVGDKHMLRELAKRNWHLAAEASGHVIQKQLSPSGDGLATALTAVQALLNRRAPDRWSWKFRPWHMRLVNLRTENYKSIKLCSNLLKTTKDLELEYGTALRIVVRWSGTESKLRLMAEAKSEDLTDYALNMLESAARSDLVIKGDR